MSKKSVGHEEASKSQITVHVLQTVPQVVRYTVQLYAGIQQYRYKQQR